MIGDWVRVNRDGLCIKKDTIVQVRGIDGDDKIEEKGLFGSAHCHPLDEAQFDGGIWLDYLDPIPITPEILEKNGFKMFALNEDEAVGFCGKWWSNDGDVMVKKFKFEYMGDMFYMSSRNSKISNIRSVHQFQNALRLCGINKEITI